MNCEKCNTLNPSSAKYCRSCGAILSAELFSDRHPQYKLIPFSIYTTETPWWSYILSFLSILGILYFGFNASVYLAIGLIGLGFEELLFLLSSIMGSLSVLDTFLIALIIAIFLGCILIAIIRYKDNNVFFYPLLILSVFGFLYAMFIASFAFHVGLFRLIGTNPLILFHIKSDIADTLLMAFFTTSFVTVMLIYVTYFMFKLSYRNKRLRKQNFDYIENSNQKFVFVVKDEKFGLLHKSSVKIMIPMIYSLLAWKDYGMTLYAWKGGDKCIIDINGNVLK